HVDARERRTRGRRHDLPIVETNDGDVVGYGEPTIAQRLGRAAGDLVVAAKERVGHLCLTVEEYADRVATPSFGPGAREIVAIDLGQPRLRQRCGVSAMAQPHRL